MILKSFLVGRIINMKKSNIGLAILIVIAVAIVFYFSFVYEKPEPQFWGGKKLIEINGQQLEIKKGIKEKSQSPPGSGNEYKSKIYDGVLDEGGSPREGVYIGKYEERFPNGKKKIQAKYKVYNNYLTYCKSASQSGASVGEVTNKYRDIGNGRCITLSGKYTEWELDGNGKTRKKIEVKFKGGLMHGKAILYENGKKKNVDKWVDGFKDGVFVVYKDDGETVDKKGENEVEVVEEARHVPDPLDPDMLGVDIPEVKEDVPAGPVCYKSNPYNEVGPDGVGIPDSYICVALDSGKAAEAKSDAAINGEDPREELNQDFSGFDPDGVWAVGTVFWDGWDDLSGTFVKKNAGNYAPVPDGPPAKHGKFDETVFPSQKSNEQVLNELRNAVQKLIAAAGSEEEAPFVDIAVDEEPQTDPEQDIIDPVPKKLDITYKKGDEVLVEGEAVDPRNDEVVASVESPRTVDPVTREKILTGKQVARASLSVRKKFPYNIHGFGGRGTLFVNPDIAQSGKGNVIWEYNVEKDRAYKDLKYWLKVQDPDTGDWSHRLWMESEKGATYPSYPSEMHLGGKFKQYSTVNGKIIAEGEHEFGSRVRLWKFRKVDNIGGIDYNPVKRLYFYEDNAWSPDGSTSPGVLCWHIGLWLGRTPNPTDPDDQPYRFTGSQGIDSIHCKDPPSYNIYNDIALLPHDWNILDGDF
jgi:hypothetical protein